MATIMLEQQSQAVVGYDDGQVSTWEQRAVSLVRAALCLSLRDRLAAAAPTTWDVGLDLLDRDDLALHRRGLVWLLRVLAITPNTGCTVARRLLAERTGAME